MTQMHLVRREPDAPARAAVLVLHGGRQDSVAPVAASRNLSYLRMVPIQRHLFRKLADRQVAVWLLRYRVRGWNASSGREPDPVRDARDALAEIRAAHPGVPIVVLGHSMGGRTACAVADEDRVVGVCGLAPWLPEGEPIEPVKGRPLVVHHGTRDGWTSAALSRAYVERLVSHGSPAEWHAVEGAGHFMLKERGTWNRLTRDTVTRLLGPDHG